MGSLPSAPEAHAPCRRESHMSRKINAGVHLAVVLAVATLAGCASAPAPSASEEPATSTTLSGPPDVPTIGCNAAALRQSVLQRVNQARTSGQMCGDGKQAALKALVWQARPAAAGPRRAPATGRGA